MYLIYGIQKSGLSIVNFFENKKIKFKIWDDSLSPDSWAAAGVEDALLDGGGIGQATDHPTKGIYFMDELAFGGAADGRVAGLPGDSIEIEAEQGGVQAQAGGRNRRFTACMAAADHDHVEGFGGGGAEAHASII